jgi:undecaprenyl-diphosphatase
VPVFDRVAITAERRFWQWTSDLGLLAVAGGVTLDLTRRDEGGRVLAAAGGAVLTMGITEILKHIVGRPRPDRYLEGSTAECLGDSFPSGHTSVVFSLATSYWLAQRDLDGNPGVEGWVTLAGAGMVGLSRVAAGRHFPSDVLAGAVLGSGIGVGLYQIRF